MSFSPVSAEEITVAVASNFTGAMNTLVADYESETSHRVRLVFGSSGRFYAQIANGAPFHVFFSADQAKPMALEDAGLVVPNSRFTYAVGGLVLWSSKADLVDSDGDILRTGGFGKLAIANPRLAPYGVAATEVLQNLRLTDLVQAKIVQGENISQAYQFVATGNADVGFVALSQVMKEGRLVNGSGWIVPPELHDPIRQDAVLLRRGEDSPAARQLLEFVRGDRGRAIIESFGYRAGG